MRERVRVREGMHAAGERTSTRRIILDEKYAAMIEYATTKILALLGSNQR